MVKNMATGVTSGNSAMSDSANSNVKAANSKMRASFSRRTFCKSAAVATTGVVAGSLFMGSALAACSSKQTNNDTRADGTSALGNGAGNQSSQLEQVFQCVCSGDCGGSCAMNVHVRDGKVVKTSKIDMPDPLMTRICQRGLSHAQRVYAPERLKYPMRRAGERGEDKWEQISWDEAISEVCSHFKASIDSYGPMSVAFQCGTGNSSPDQYYNTRLLNAIGGTAIYPMADMNGLYMAALMVTRGPYLHGGSLNQVLKSKKIFIWGSNTTTSGHTKWSYVLAAREKGAKIIVIDPNYTVAASKADIWVPLQPGTDAALAMAMTKVIVQDGLADIDYLTKGTVAPFLVRDDNGMFLRFSDIGLAEKKSGGEGIKLDGAASSQATQDDGSDPIVVIGKDGKYGDRAKIDDPVIEGSYTVEGIACKTAYTLLLERIDEWTLDRAAKVCDVPADTIRMLAHEYAAGPTMNYLGFGMDHWVNGAYPYHAIITMAFVSGNFGKPGASIDGNMQGSMGIVGVNVGNAMAFEGMQQGMALTSQHLPEVIDTGQLAGIPLKIDSLFVYRGNPIAGLPDLREYLRFIDQLSFFVVADSVMSDTVKMADLVLPVPHWFEVEGFEAGVLPFVRMNEQAIKPLYESKSDIDICNLIGKGMGLANIMNMTADDFHSACMSDEGAAAVGLSWQALKEKKMIQVLPDDYVFGDNYTLTTPTGKAEFYFENIAPMMPFGAPPDRELLSLPHWEAPYEGWHENPLTQKYPLVLMTHRDKARVNSMFSYCPWLEELFCEPTLDLNPADAEARGIKTGDTVRAFNDRGTVTMRARVNPAVRPGFVDTPRGANADRYIDGTYGSLTTGAYNNLVQTGGWNDTLVQIEKI
jgi:molybdopterin-containing oxidoreductase family molybdopterin binding subunit